MASSLTTSTVISPVTERVFVAPVRRSMTANALRPADGVASRAGPNPFRHRAGGRGSLAEARGDPQRVVARYLRLEAERHAVLLPEQRVAGEAQRLGLGVAGLVAIEEEVRLPFDPEPLATVHRHVLDPRAG